jgi:hypothetical protein
MSEGELPMIPPSSVEVALALVLALDASRRASRGPGRPGSVERVSDPNPPNDCVGETPSTPPDLAAIERDLAAVEAALTALDDGSYWVDEVTGEPIPDEVLATNPVARRV